MVALKYLYALELGRNMKHFFINTALLVLASEAVADGLRDFQQENRQRQREFSYTQQQNWISNHRYTQSVEDSEDTENQAQDCLPFQAVHFRNVTLIDQRAWTVKKGECLNEARLNQLSRELTAAYLKEGYIHTPFHFVSEGNRLIVVVKEGKIRDISSESDRLNFAMLLPQKKGKALNIRDLDQALDQANKLPNSSVTVDVLPYSDGNVDLKFENQETKKVGGNIAFNNYSSKSYQRWQTRVGLNVDSPLGLSDSLAFSLSHTLNGTNQFSRSASLYYSVPYGYWSFNAMAALSQFRQQIALQQTSVQQKGETHQASLGADYVFHRGSNHISTISAQLDRINSKSYFADTMLILQSPKLSAAQVGFSHLQLLENGALIANVQYKHGLSWFNALPNLGRDQPEGHYGKWNAELQWQHYHRFGEQLFRRSHQLLGQYSQNYLPAVEQADLTGRYAVRSGDISWSAEKVLLLRNQLSWLTSVKSVGLSPYIALDVGIARSTAENAEQQQAWGYALGINSDYKRLWNAQLEWSNGQARLAKDQPMRKQHKLDFSVQLAF